MHPAFGTSCWTSAALAMPHPPPRLPSPSPPLDLLTLRTTSNPVGINPSCLCEFSTSRNVNIQNKACEKGTVLRLLPVFWELAQFQDTRGAGLERWGPHSERMVCASSQPGVARGTQVFAQRAPTLPISSCFFSLLFSWYLHLVL